MFKKIVLLALLGATLDMSAKNHRAHKHYSHKHHKGVKPIKSSVQDLHLHLDRVHAHLLNMTKDNHALELGAKKNIELHLAHLHLALNRKMSKVSAHSSKHFDGLMNKKRAHSPKHFDGFVGLPHFDVETAKKAHPASENHAMVSSDHRDVHAELHLAKKHLDMLSGAKLNKHARSVKKLRYKMRKAMKLLKAAPVKGDVLMARKSAPVKRDVLMARKSAPVKRDVLMARKMPAMRVAR